MAAAPYRVVVVEDHPIFLDGLVGCLAAERDFEVVEQFGDATVSTGALADVRPDVVLMDIELPGGSGIELTRRLRAALPATPVVILTAPSSTRSCSSPPCRRAPPGTCSSTCRSRSSWRRSGACSRARRCSRRHSPRGRCASSRPTKPDGIGLGLVLARELVEAHGGTITWRPARPGTTFSVVLPRAVPPSPAAAG